MSTKYKAGFPADGSKKYSIPLTASSGSSAVSFSSTFFVNAMRAPFFSVTRKSVIAGGGASERMSFMPSFVIRHEKGINPADARAVSAAV